MVNNYFPLCLVRAVSLTNKVASLMSRVWYCTDTGNTNTVCNTIALLPTTVEWAMRLFLLLLGGASYALVSKVMRQLSWEPGNTSCKLDAMYRAYCISWPLEPRADVRRVSYVDRALYESLAIRQASHDVLGWGGIWNTRSIKYNVVVLLCKVPRPNAVWV